MMRSCAGSIAVVFVLCAAGTSAAQGTRQELQNVQTLSCEFRLLATGTWRADGSATAEVTPAKLALGFSKIDTQDGSAEVAGSFGSPEIVVQFRGGYLHFMQIGSSGFLYTTTVFDKVNRPGKLKAVHTRHEYTEVALPGYTSRPQQYYGECEIR